MAVMTNAQHGAAQSGSMIAKLANSVKRAFAAMMEAQTRQNEVSMLSNKTDEELAQMGLTRDGIARYVFRDRLYM
ncbi:hypothetical protein ERN12_01835 [Rhodobacteraceae bacterium]|nr:hypothetical protein ERN12_01835 [Paracoccaceae bacterium]